MRIVAIGNRTFVAAFRLAGVEGIEIKSSEELYKKIIKLIEGKDVGLIMISDEMAKSIRDKISELKSNFAVPLIYEVPAPGSKIESMDYRDIVKKILGF
ncbi:MAG: V-type ATP synthase subunit F [Nitrososphaerales archaeon]